MGNFTNARRSFNASLSSLNAKEESEKYNLYSGLAELAAGLEILEGTIQELHSEVERIYQAS